VKPETPESCPRTSLIIFGTFMVIACVGLVGCRERKSTPAGARTFLTGTWKYDATLTAALPENQGKGRPGDATAIFGPQSEQTFGFGSDDQCWIQGKSGPKKTGTYKVLSAEKGVIRVESTIEGKTTQEVYRALGPDQLAHVRSKNDIWPVAQRRSLQ
jgi:hypothetical protein